MTPASPPDAVHVSVSRALPASLVMLLAGGAGLSVASLYYAQPMLGVLGADMNASAHDVGLVPTFTQLGYALGILLLAPLGDRFDRRNIILGKAVALCAALALAAAAPTFSVLLAASLCIGLTATLAQDLVPAAATLAPDAQRGKTVGMVMTGLLLGILLSRVVAGFVAEHVGWRAMFGAAAASIALLALALRAGLPRFAPTTQLPYGALLASLGALWRKYPALRRATLAQGLISVGFSAFWSTLAVMLHGAPFHLGASAAGALAAPLAGRMADKRGSERVIRLGCALVVGGFVAMAVAPGQLWLIAAGAVVFDLGVQAALIAHQSIIYSLEPAARSRLNAVFFTGVFVGMASGAWLGSLALAAGGWRGVCGLAASAGLAALAVRWWPARQ